MATKTNRPVLRKPRIVKVYDHHVNYNGHLLYKTHVVYPKIRLAGKWLADCGFAPGQHIEITPGLHQLTIRVLNVSAAELNAENLPRPRQKPGRRPHMPYLTSKKPYAPMPEVDTPAQKVPPPAKMPRSGGKNTDLPAAEPRALTAGLNVGYRNVKSDFSLWWHGLP